MKGGLNEYYEGTEGVGKEVDFIYGELNGYEAK